MLPFPPSSSFRAEGEESRYAKHMREMLLNTSQREGAAGGKGEGNRLPAAGRFQLDTFGFISRNCITMISGLRPLSPFGACGTTFPPQKRGAQQPVLFLEPLMNTKVRGALLSHRLRGEGGGDSHQGGPPPKGGIYTGAARRRTSPAERYYITPEGRARRTSPEGEADPGQNPGSPGPQARRRHQPSARRAVNLREYSQAPPSLPKAPHLKYRTQQKSTSHQTSAFSS